MNDKNSGKINDILSAISELNSQLKTIENSPSDADIIIDNITQENSLKIRRKEKVLELKRLLEPYDLGVLSRFPTLNEKDSPKYFAMLDILGFSKIVENQDSDSLKKIFENIIVRWVQMALTYGEKFDINLDRSFSPDLNKAKINHIVFSDTLMFWTNSNSPKEFLELLKAISILYSFSINYGFVPFRGAITYGDLQYQDPLFVLSNIKFNQSILFGKAVVDAYKLEKSQEWMGCILSNDCIETFYNKKPTSEQEQELKEYVIKYNVPFKRKTLNDEEYFVINWPNKFNDDLSKIDRKIKQVFTLLSKTENLEKDESVFAKFQNTIAFYRDIK